MANPTHEIVLEGFIPVEDQGGYRHLPFEVPPGTARLEIAYNYGTRDDAGKWTANRSTIDIGLFDQRGIEFLSAGFRGWSGSGRAEFYLSTEDSTPGYIGGALLPGTWNIVLGLYKVAPAGCQYQVVVRLFANPVGDQNITSLRLNTQLTTPTLPRRADNWYRGELHCHSHHSDGDSPAQDVIAAAQSLGLDFLAITDHNVRTQWNDQTTPASERPVLIRGCEVTTNKGHWNIWGGTEWVDFRVTTPEQIEQCIRRAIELGYLTSCNHPYWPGSVWDFQEVRGHECLEVWNGPWQWANNDSLDWWDRRLAAGERLVAVGGSDMHHLKTFKYSSIGTPTTWIYCPETPTAENLLAALRKGHAFLSESPDGPQLYLQSDKALMGDTIPRPPDDEISVQVRVVNAQGHILELRGATGCLNSVTPQSDDETFNIALSVSETPYVRAQLVDSIPERRPVHALTNPIYIK